MITGFNNNIATRPFPETANKVEIVNGVAVTQSRISLVPLEVVFAGGAVNVGDTVYVTKESINHQWAKNIMQIEGETVIICPLASVQLIKRGSGWSDQMGTSAA